MGLLRTYSDGLDGLVQLLDKVELLDGSIGQVITIANDHRMEVRLDSGKIVETDPQTKIVRIVKESQSLASLLPESAQLSMITQTLEDELSDLLPPHSCTREQCNGFYSLR